MKPDLSTLLADLEEQDVITLVNQRLEAGDNPLKILEEARKGMETVGQRFAKGEYFIPDLIYSGEILKGVSEIVKPRISEQGETKKLGKVIIGTVAGDIHDIGKDIVVFMLDISGFEVIDLGIDVPAGVFVDKIKETGATVVGLSGFLTLAFDAMKTTVEAISNAGLRDNVKVMIGGGLIDETICRYTGADDFGRDAMAAVRMAKGWLS